MPDSKDIEDAMATVGRVMVARMSADLGLLLAEVKRSPDTGAKAAICRAFGQGLRGAATIGLGGDAKAFLSELAGYIMGPDGYVVSRTGGEGGQA